MFITSKTKYLSNDMKIFGMNSIPLSKGKLLIRNSSNDVQIRLFVAMESY